jgi:hypothetical protein
MELKNLNEHNSLRAVYYNTEEKVRNGIACPECGSELIDSQPMMTLTSYPPQKSTSCENCDYTGYRLS